MKEGERTNKLEKAKKAIEEWYRETYPNKKKLIFEDAIEAFRNKVIKEALDKVLKENSSQV